MKEKNKVLKHYNLTLDENIVKQLQDRGFKISQTVRNLLEKKLEREKSIDV